MLKPMPGTRVFILLCLAVALAVLAVPFLGVQIPTVLTAEASQGMAVWRSNGCEGCHTIYGQGGIYAPDLTHIYSQRGDTYLREFLVNPGAFHVNQRVMPRFGLTVSQTDHLLAFLSWIDQNNDWPPHMIRVSGGADNIAVGVVAAAEAAPVTQAVPDDPAAAGRLWFSRPPANCATCHSLEPDVIIVGPSLAGVATRAQTRVPGTSAEEYLRTSLLHPGEFIVPGFNNVMAQNLGEVLTGDQINQLIAFLLTLE